MGAPSAASLPPSGETSGQAATRALPVARANAAARAGGGISPQFLAGVVSEQSGSPGAGLEILAQIQQSLGQ